MFTTYEEKIYFSYSVAAAKKGGSYFVLVLLAFFGNVCMRLFKAAACMQRRIRAIYLSVDLSMYDLLTYFIIHLLLQSLERVEATVTRKKSPESLFV